MLPCQYFVLRRCNKGEACSYSHDPSIARPGGAGMICRDFNATGVCRFGDRCIYVHRTGENVDRAVFYGQNQGDEELVGMYGSAPYNQSNIKGPTKASSTTTSWAKVARLPGQGDATIEQDNSRPDEPVQPSLSNSAWSTSKLKASLDGSGHHGQVETKNVDNLTDAGGAASKPQSVSKIPCKFFQSPAGCRFGDSCRYSHESINILPPMGGDQSSEPNCGICLEPLRFKRIGILTHCDHLFCLSCIKKWRGSEMADFDNTKELVQLCPVCRVRSFFVVPSDAIPSSKVEKDQIIDQFRKKCGLTPCKYGDDGCPFGASCLYKHTVIDPAKLGLRFLKTADGRDRAMAPTVAKMGDLLLK